MTTRTRPPFDPELGAALEALDWHLPSLATDEGIAAMRQAITAMSPSDEELRRGGAVDVHERSIPASDGTAKLGLLVCRRTGDERARAGHLPHARRGHGGR